MRSQVVRPLKWLGIALAVLFVVLALLAGGLWWWSGTQGSLDWALRQAAKSQDLQVQGAKGSLRGGVTADSIRWTQEGLKVEVDEAQMAWQPLSLIRGTVEVDYLRASRVRVEDKRPPQPKSGPPESFALPLRVQVSEFKVGEVRFATGETTQEASNIAGRYAYNGANHNLRFEDLQYEGGMYSGEATVGARGELPVNAKVRGRFEAPVPGSTTKLPLAFEAALDGPLTNMQARAQLQGRPNTPTANTRATATARVTPWETQPIAQGQAQFQALDTSVLWPEAPRTQLSGSASVRPSGTQTWVVEADVANAAPGPWDEKKLPLEQINAQAEVRNDGQALVRSLVAKVGGGEIRANGEWHGADGWTVDAELARVNPAALHTDMASVPVGGTASARGQGDAIDFNADLKAQGPARGLGGIEVQSLTAKGRWADGLLSLPSLDARLADAALKASVEVRPDTMSGSGSARLEAPGLQARVEGKISEASGGGTAQVSSDDLARTLAWLARIPGVPEDVGAQIAAGRGEVRASWQGGWRDPAVQATASAPVIELRGEAPAMVVRDASVRVDGRLRDAAVEASARVEQGQRRISAQLAGRAGQRAAQSAWQGQLGSLNASIIDPALGKGQWSLSLQRAIDWRYAPDRIEVGAGQASLKSPRPGDTPAVIAWDPVRMRGGELSTSGRLTGLPLAWMEIIGGPQFAGPLAGDMVFEGQWDANLGNTPRIRASLSRSSGDLVVLAPNAEGQATRVQAGVRQARIDVTTQGDTLAATLKWDSERAGTAEGRVTTRMARSESGGWQWREDAPIDGVIRAQLPRIGVWSVLAPPGWRLRGSLVADVRVGGTRSDPQLTGTISADDLGLRSVVDGVELQGGRLRVRLDGRRLIVEELMLRGPGENGGSVVAKGEGALTAAGPQVRLEARLDRLRASIRSDRQLTVSGTVVAKRDPSGTTVNGDLKVDQALIVLPDEGTPKLGDDVVVRNADGPIRQVEQRAADRSATPAADKVRMEVNIDLGNQFRVQGLGVDTRLVGTLTVRGESLDSPRLVGTIRTAGGEYRAYGQRLDIERGIIRFTGALDNPALDILAVRPRISQRVGVQVTGTAMAPFVRLYSEPNLPDVEKLSWLLTGRAAPATGAESQLVQQAALALLASRSGGGKKGIAASLGLDELSFRREGSNGGGPSLTLGRRLGRNLYAAYERSLGGALGTLFIFYDLSQKLTVRAQTGERTAVDLIYTFTFD